MATVASLVVAFALGAGGVPFDRPAIGTMDRTANVVGQIGLIVFALVVIAVAWWITRKRPAIDFDARTPARAIAKQEAIALLVYGTIVLSIGGFLGIGMHLHGAVFGPTRELMPREVYVWAGYNFLFFAAIPYFVFRRRGNGHQAMGLNRRMSRAIRSSFLWCWCWKALAS